MCRAALVATPSAQGSIAAALRSHYGGPRYGPVMAGLGDCNFRVIVRGADPEDDFHLVIQATPDLILFGGHGGGTIGAGCELPAVDTWSVYAKAESPEDAEAKVAGAIKALKPQRFIVGVEPFDPND